MEVKDHENRILRPSLYHKRGCRYAWRTRPDPEVLRAGWDCRAIALQGQQTALLPGGHRTAAPGEGPYRGPGSQSRWRRGNHEDGTAHGRDGAGDTGVAGKGEAP